MYDENRFPLESVPARWLDRHKPLPRRGISCLHGHFPLRKYLRLAINWNNVFVVWLREPLQWRISLYYFWKQNYLHQTDKYLNRIFDENWDLGRFCMDPTFDNYQSRYLAWFPRRRINFIGVTENYASDLDYLSRHISHRQLTFHKKNESKKPDGLLARGFGPQFLRRFESNNRIDYQNYRAAKRASDADWEEKQPQAETARYSRCGSWTNSCF